MIETVLTGKVEQKKKPSIPPPIKLFHKIVLDGFTTGLDELLYTIKNKVILKYDINVIWNTFKTELHRLVDSYVPTKQRKPRNLHEPLWFNDEARQACKKQRKFYNCFQKSGDTDHLAKYKE